MAERPAAFTGTPATSSRPTSQPVSQHNDVAAYGSPFSFHRPPSGPDGWPLPPPRLPETPEAVRDQRNADSLGPQGTPSEVGQLAIWGPPAMTPQNQVTHSRLGQMTPWGGTGHVGPMARSVQRASGLLDEMSRQEAADREKLKRREDERRASKKALDSYLIGDHIEKLLARCAAWPSAPPHHRLPKSCPNNIETMSKVLQDLPVRGLQRGPGQVPHWRPYEKAAGQVHGLAIWPSTSSIQEICPGAIEADVEVLQDLAVSCHVCRCMP